MVGDLTDGGRLAGDPLILDAGREIVWLGGWSADDRSLLFEGVGVPGQNRWSHFRIDVASGAAPVNLTADDPDPFPPLPLSVGGSLGVYKARRVAGSAIFTWDLPGGGGSR